MFSFNKKLDPNLKSYMEFNISRDYRVIIKCRNFQDSIIKKIFSYKGVVLRKIEACSIISAKVNSKAIEKLLEYPEVEYITLDKYFHLCGMSIQTANKIRLSNKVNITGKNIGVGVIDSGVYPHSDLTLPFNKLSSFTDLVNGLLYPYDDNGHGTCTCGIIGGTGEASNGVYKGIAPDVSIHCYKAFDKLGKGFVSDILFALEDLINISSKYNIKVICLPFELLNFDKFIFNNFDILLKKCVQNNIIAIVPSGSNKNDDGSLTGIALSKNCITISGIDTTSSPESYQYSSSGAIKKDIKPDFCAACVDIVSLNCNTSYISEKNKTKVFAPKLASSYKSFTGTSLAAAYVAGLCALLFEYNPSLSFDDVLSLFKVSSDNLELPVNKQGDGTININKILQK